jgi:hypothetical protein
MCSLDVAANIGAKGGAVMSEKVIIYGKGG